MADIEAVPNAPENSCASMRRFLPAVVLDDGRSPRMRSSLSCGEVCAATEAWQTPCTQPEYAAPDLPAQPLMRPKLNSPRLRINRAKPPVYLRLLVKHKHLGAQVLALARKILNKRRPTPSRPTPTCECRTTMVSKGVRGASMPNQSSGCGGHHAHVCYGSELERSSLRSTGGGEYAHHDQGSCYWEH